MSADAATRREIPDATVARLPEYLRALTDFAEDDGAYPRAVVLQQPRLATFNLQVLDANDTVVQSVCLGTDYKIRFSLTVPPGRGPVTWPLPPGPAASDCSPSPGRC